MKQSRVINEASKIKSNFSQKIKSVEEVKNIIGSRSIKQKVVMCHGTFDIVHPGHIRQLIYAKSKGDILIVSLTADQHIIKGPMRPYVPGKLRALNLAAFEIVDFVIIDQNPTPLKNISFLQPDFFVKGFEYSLNGIHPKTREEMDVLAKYGGKFLFSPGDIVFSSSKLLTTQKPNLSLEHLLTIMQAENVTFKDIRQTLEMFKGLNIHVIGDTIVDRYSIVSVVGISQKSPAIHVQFNETNTYIGGAGIVAKHFRSLGARVTLTTVLGKDEIGEYTINDLKKCGIKVNPIIDPSRSTTIKERFLTSEDIVLFQVDTGDNTPIPYGLTDTISNLVSKSKADVVICSDFRHGLFNKESIKKIVSSIPKKALKIADSQVSNRWGNILDFSDFDLITPNEREARYALGDQETTIRPLAQKLYNEARCKYLILKLGKDGIITYHSPGREHREYFYIDSFTHNIVDPIGAGDALLAAAAAGLSASNDIIHAAILGNACAAVECEKFGNIPVSAKELEERIIDLEKKAKGI